MLVVVDVREKGNSFKIQWSQHGNQTSPMSVPPYWLSSPSTLATTQLHLFPATQTRFHVGLLLSRTQPNTNPFLQSYLDTAILLPSPILIPIFLCHSPTSTRASSPTPPTKRFHCYWFNSNSHKARL